jgi:bifunctional NMN adenylyltransferase/nudix hydrolase
VSRHTAPTVCIGHFRIPDREAVAQLQRALDDADAPLVLVGSAFLPRSPRNPFTWQERCEMLGAALPEALRPRVRFAPLRERYEDSERTGRDIRAAIERHGLQPDAVRRVQLDEPPEGSPLTPMLFSGASPEAVRKALAARVPDSTLAFLRGWLDGAAHQRLCDEWRQLAE